MTKKWNSLRLPRDNDQALKEAWALPLIPPNRFQEALEIIVASAELIEPEHKNVLRFIHYLFRQWLPLSDIVSVWNSPWRTNNFAEAFNRHLIARLNGEYPALFTFLCKYGNNRCMSITGKNVEHFIPACSPPSSSARVAILHVRKKYSTLLPSCKTYDSIFNVILNFVSNCR